MTISSVRQAAWCWCAATSMTITNRGQWIRGWTFMLVLVGRDCIAVAPFLGFLAVNDGGLNLSCYYRQRQHRRSFDSRGQRCDCPIVRPCRECARGVVGCPLSYRHYRKESSGSLCPIQLCCNRARYARLTLHVQSKSIDCQQCGA